MSTSNPPPGIHENPAIEAQSPLWRRPALIWLLLYPFAWLGLFGISSMLWYLPAGLRLGTLWLLPRLTPSVVYIMMWKFIGADAPYGVINRYLLGPLGVPSANLTNTEPFLFVILTNGFLGASFGMIVFTSAIESIPRDYMMAALVDGCTAWQRIRYVILPMIRWPLLFVTTYQTLSLLTSYEQILLLTDGAGGTEVWALWSYHRALNNYWGNFQWGFGAALAMLLVIIGIVMSVIYMRFFRFGDLIQEPRIEAL